jgi:hypothetical protein
MRFEGNRIDLRRFERRPGEILLSEDLLARHVINLVHGRLITGNEIEIADSSTADLSHFSFKVKIFLSFHFMEMMIIKDLLIQIDAVSQQILLFLTLL